jgi:hypothetical protein
MEKRVFGRTGMQLSVLGFGCGAVGGLMVRGDPLNRERSIARAIAAGLLRHRGPIWQRRIGKRTSAASYRNSRIPDLERAMGQSKSPPLCRFPPTSGTPGLLITSIRVGAGTFVSAPVLIDLWSSR